MSNQKVKFISVEEVAERVVDAVPEVVSFEIRTGSMRLYFDRPRRIPGTDVFTGSTTVTVAESRIPEWTVTDVIQRLRVMFDNSSGMIKPVIPKLSKKPKLSKR
jgi:hypothetical protein